MESKAKSFFKNIRLILVAFIVLATSLFMCACEDTETFNIALTYISGSATIPVLSGRGSYQTGETVVLKASGTGSCHFIGWLYQNKTLIKNNDTYTISISEDYMSSTLTFKADKTTADNYTAIFEDPSQTYYTMTSYKFSKEDDDPKQELTTEYSTPLFQGSFKVDFGDENNTQNRTVFSTEPDTTFNQCVKVETPENTQVVSVYNSTPSIRLTLNTPDRTFNTVAYFTYLQDYIGDDVALKFNQDKSFTLEYHFKTQDFVTLEKDCVLYITISPLSFNVDLGDSNIEGGPDARA